MKKRPQHRLTKCLKPKNQYFPWKTKLAIKKSNDFHWKTILDDKKPSAPLKINSGPPKKLKGPLQTQWNVAKTESSLWKLISLLKRPINSNEKTPTAPSYKMPEAKKPILSLKAKLATKKQRFSLKNDLGWQKTERTIENQLGAVQKIKESFENAMKCCKNTKLSLKTHFAFKEAYKFQ